MAKSNYEITKEKMQTHFLSFDQERMIRQFDLRHDDDYLYLRFIGRMYRIGRRNGKVWWEQAVPRTDGGLQEVSCVEADFNEAMSIYDVLCCSKDGCRLSGRFARINSMKGTVHSSGLGDMLYTGAAEKFDGRAELLRSACERLGGIRESVGDVAYRLPTFDFLPVIVQFWESDEEFPASFQILWDENVLDFMHYETTYYTAGHLLTRLEEIMKEHG